MVQAVKIALEVKKYLVDNDFMDISQVQCTGMPLVLTRLSSMLPVC